MVTKNDIDTAQFALPGLPQIETAEALPASGSDRRYFRLRLANGGTAMGAYNPDTGENETFARITNHLGNSGIPVPKFLGFAPDHRYYLCTDCGSATLFDLLDNRPDGDLEPELFELCAKALECLPTIQSSLDAAPDEELAATLPRFDRRALMWDLNYFKYNYLKMSGTRYDESALEDDFERLSDRIAAIQPVGFMYRDFQSRNIMVKDNNLYFIDYQGARIGPAQYDAASFLWQARARFTDNDRVRLLDHYLDALQRIRPVDRDAFVADYHNVVLHRLLQVLGAYGFRGLYEKKTHFLRSIRQAVPQLARLFAAARLADHYPQLARCVDQMADAVAAEIDIDKTNEDQELVVSVSSFSYLNGGYPTDLTGNGGGYVFDCRGLPNPGRLPQYRSLRGYDAPVADFLRQHDQVATFLDTACDLVLRHAEAYAQRGFRSLSAAFGCTGGQHRSVYCAEYLHKFLRNKGIKTKLCHRESPRK